MVSLDRLASRGVTIEFAAQALRRGEDPQRVAELLEQHAKQLYTVKPRDIPGLLPKLVKEVGL